MTSITVYDGTSTIGGNKIYVEEKGKGVFLDFGLNFARYGKFYQQFLNVRSPRGIYDLITLDLIPKLNIYRSDITPAGLDLSSYPSLNIEAILLSHAHQDHCGNIGMLNPDIPIIASPITIAFLKSILDSGQSKIGLDVAYYRPRAKKKDPRFIGAAGNAEGRDFVATGNISKELSDFLTESAKSKMTINPGNNCRLDEFSCCFDIKAFEVDHSLYGANGYILYGDSTIAYSGDIRVHGKNASKSEEFIKNAKDASVLIIEGTRTSRDALGENESEEKVYSNSLKAVQEAKDLVVADFSARNFERLETFVDIAKKTGRELVISSKDAFFLRALEFVDGISRTDDIYIFDSVKSSKYVWEKQLDQDKWKDKHINSVEISKNPANYIVCFSFFDLKHLLDFEIGEGTYIYSSSETFGEEAELDFLRFDNWLEFFNFTIYGFDLVKRKDDYDLTFSKGFHASGHLSPDELKKAIKTIDPDVIIPVHTNNSKWFEDNFDKAVLLNEGQKFKL